MATNPDFGFPPTMPPPTGMSDTKKALLGCGILGGLALLACCGVGGYCIYWFNTVVSLDPVKAQEVSKSIVDISLPEGLTPVRSVDGTIPLTTLHIKAAMYEGTTPNEAAVVAEGSGGKQQSPEQVAAEIKAKLAQIGAGKQEEVAAEKTIEHKVTIRGSESTFQIVKGKNEKTGKMMWSAIGTFPGKTEEGLGLVIIALDADKYTEEQVKEIIDSIK